jgi:hypothetical protein
MCKTRLTTLVVATALVFGFTATVRATVGVRVIIENRAPDNGTWLTPVWVGFHNGGFDTYDMNLPASEALERLAEDGNADPMSALFASSGAGTIDGVIPADTGIPPIGPGETATMTFVVDNYDSHNAYFSYLAMVIPSNDAFVGNDDPQAHRLFDAYGNFLGAYLTIYGAEVLDAGTEVNDEIPEHTAFFGQTVPDSGVDEYGVVHAHPGYLPPGSGGILDDPNFANADFTAPGYQVARITIVRSDTVVPSGAVSGVWDCDGSPYLLQGDVVVPYGETLTIEPGVQVVSLCDCRLSVEGSLQAIGTEEAPILFTKDASISEWHGLHFFYGSEPSRLSHCIVEYGEADGTAPDNRGGGVYCENSTLSIDHSVLRYNGATVGGGIYCDNGDLAISYSRIAENTAYGAGGGLACNYADLLLYDNEIVENGVFGSSYGSSSVRGGGLSLEYTRALILNNNVSDNTAFVEDFYDPGYASGGAMALAGRWDPVVLIGNRITNNLAHAAYEYGSTAAGAGIWSDSVDAYLLNNTIADNVAESLPEWNEEHGGALYCYSYGIDMAIANTIMWGNVPQQISAIYEYGFFDIAVSHSDIQGGPDAVEISFNNNLNWLDGNIDADPLFADPSAGDYSLLEDSPCIDAGDPNTYPDPDGTVSDIGAFYFDQGIVGDLNGDGQVDLSDLGQLLAHYGTPSGALPEDGDLDGDGDVDLSDLGALLANYGAGPALSGACCITDQCVQSTEYACTQAGGVFHGEGTTCADVACDYWAYRNETDYTVVWPQPGAGVPIADDITLVGSGSRRLYYYDLLVGSWEGEAYDCTAELWTDCPGNGGQPIPGTSYTWTNLPVLRMSYLRADFDLVEIPETVWMVVTFTSDYAGWFIADEPQVGFTEDIYGQDLAPWSCQEVIGDDHYSGFWARVRCH